MTTWVSIYYRESHLSRRDVASLFFQVAGFTTTASEVRSQASGVVRFRIHGHYNRVIETTLNRRITDIDPLAVVRINGQRYGERGLL